MEVDKNTPEESRGTKRKATEELVNPAPQRIKALDQTVVNKIAAGEIIVAPVHALKELIENAVDAGSTSIEIVVKDGGLKLLQITDNGHGINREDLEILCERFTTSKLKTFEDLTSIGTYGFRGEALASISHIAHLMVTTKTKDSDCAWRGVYSDGKLVPAKPGQTADPKPVAGKQGTQITVEDLFYNTPSRRRAFRNPNDEYAKILDVVGRYAVHCGGVAFSCKKHAETQMGVSTQAAAKTSDRIRQIHGNAVANELIPLDVKDGKYGFEAKGMLSNANYSIKKTTLLLFINHRSVESSAIKKAFEAMYSSLLPKGGHPFVYLSLEIEPHRVDVNVHPTKREVNFLYEDEIIDLICTAAQEKLAAVDASRSFMTQTLLPNSRVPQLPKASSSNDWVPPTGPRRSSTNLSNDGKTKVYENNMVRTDARARKITSMLPAQNSSDHLPMSRSMPSDSDLGMGEYEHVDKERVKINLGSIKSLRAEVRESAHTGLTEVFANHTFVGIVDERKRLAAIQNGVKLYLVDYGAISYEYFYQIGLTDFGNFGSIKLQNPLPLMDLLRIAADYEREAEEESEDVTMDGTEPKDWEDIIEAVASQIISHRAMLLEYFAIDISEGGDLLSLPLLLKGYMPSLGKLPSFLLRLGPHVNWKNEKGCFETFLRELALFYVPEQLPTPDEEPNESQVPDEDGNTLSSMSSVEVMEERAAMIDARRKELAQVMESVLFPGYKRRLLATKSLLKSVTEVANLKGLYRIFERSC